MCDYITSYLIQNLTVPHLKNPEKQDFNIAYVITVDRCCVHSIIHV